MRKGNWTFPKGAVERGETAREAALRESREEAGLTGEIEGEPLGEYEYTKGGKRQRVTVYLMQVAEAADVWLESPLRERRWVTLEEARVLMEHHGRREMLELAAARFLPSSRRSGDEAGS